MFTQLIFFYNIHVINGPQHKTEKVQLHAVNGKVKNQHSNHSHQLYIKVIIIVIMHG